MHLFTHFSRHAFQRLSERTRLTCEDAAWILDQGRYVNSGKAPASNREHLVFYSAVDNEIFVAVRDCLTGTVVTVLPPEYQANLAWPVSERERAKAKELVLCMPARTATDIQTVGPTRFIVSAHYRDTLGLQKTKVLLKTSSAAYGNQTRRFIRESNVFDQVPALAQAKGIDDRMVFGLSVRLGHRADPIILDFPNAIPNAALQPTAFGGG